MFKKLMNSSLIAILCAAPILQAHNIQPGDAQEIKTTKVQQVIDHLKNNPKKYTAGTGLSFLILMLSNEKAFDLGCGAIVGFMGGVLWPFTVHDTFKSFMNKRQTLSRFVLIYILSMYAAGVATSIYGSVKLVNKIRSKMNKPTRPQVA